MWINFHWIWRLIYDIHKKTLIHVTLDISEVTITKRLCIYVDIQSTRKKHITNIAG